MAFVKTFRIHPMYGIPDREVREWLSQCEQDAIINVATVYIPGAGEIDPRLTVIATKLDDIHVSPLSEEEKTTLK